jgi:hypothetical protein
MSAMIELKNTKTVYLGKTSGADRYALDACVGALQMRDSGGEWQDIKPALVRDADGWHTEGTPYYAEIKDDGTRLFCPDKNERGKYLKLPAVALLSEPAKNIVESASKLDGSLTPNQVIMPTSWGEIRVIFSNTGMHFEVLFREAPPSDVFGKDSPRILLDAEASGYDIGQLLQSAAGVGIPRPRLMAYGTAPADDLSRIKSLDWAYKNGQLELGFDFTGLTFPVLLKNTTIDIQVEANEDDGIAYNGGIYPNESWNMVGRGSSGVFDIWLRFLGVSVPLGSTIDVAYVQVDENTTNKTCYTNIFIDKQSSPAVPSSYSDYYSRTLTSAVAWDGVVTPSGWKDSPSLVSIVQELVDAYTCNDLQIIWKDDGTATNEYRRFYSHNLADYLAPKLHIEYTSGGGATAKTSNDSGSGADLKGDFDASIVKADSGSGLDSYGSFLAGLNRNDEGVALESMIGRGLAVGDVGTGGEALKTLLALLLRADAGSGTESGVLSSILARLSADAGTGSEISGLVTALLKGETGHGVDAASLVGLRMILDGDAGGGLDRLKALVGLPGGGAGMTLPAHPGHVNMPHTRG